ncbi:MAG: adenylate/guanylate cyclase domain-containing protein [Planctomycetota bacterium]|nr:adenylate/guanylate cyclase domain-containing protein [Planctomycetota bacterium]
MPKPEKRKKSKAHGKHELESLIAERYRFAQQANPHAAKRVRELDRRIRGRYERVVAPFVLDMAGFTRITMHHGIIHYLSLIHRMREICIPVVRRHKGALVKTDADNLFAHFPDVTAAVEASLDIQETVADANFDTDDDFDIYACVGIGYGPVLVLDHDMWGGEFNIACKLGEDIAGSGEILLTQAARRALKSESYALRKRVLTLCGMSYDAWLVRGRRRARREDA